MENTESEITPRGQQPTHPECANAKPIILVMHASVGSGHKSAADAIVNALELQIKSGQKVIPQQPDDIYIEELDALRFARWYIDGNKTASGFIGPTRPFYDVTWRYGFTGRILWNGGEHWMRIMFPKFLRWIEINRPVAVVCTHIAAANIAVGARVATKQTYPVICVPTDYEVEGQFPTHRTDLFCCASEYMAETLRARNVPEDRIRITGIPVNPKFSLPHNKAESREKWNIRDGRLTALVLAGAKLPKPYERFRATLFELLPMLRSIPDMDFIFVCGTDEEYAAKLNASIEKNQLENVRVLGYVTEMAELMNACDFAVCKAGGLTVTECLCARVPMVLVGKTYGQEKVNMRLLTSMGAALHVTTARELFDTLTYVNRTPSGLETLVYNGGMIRRPNAAQDIAKSTLNLAFEPIDQATVDDRTKYQFVFCWGDRPAHTR